MEGKTFSLRASSRESEMVEIASACSLPGLQEIASDFARNGRAELPST